MNDLVKVEGTNEEFCDTTIVERIVINGVCRSFYPRDFNHLFLKDYRNTKNLIKQRKELTILTLCMNNLYNLFDRDYWVNAFSYKLHLLLQLMPNKYYKEEKYYPPVIRHNIQEIYLEIIKIKSQGIAYLEQKYYQEYKKEIDILKELSKSTSKISFDEYINDWAQRLLKPKDL